MEVRHSDIESERGMVENEVSLQCKLKSSWDQDGSGQYEQFKI